MERHLGYTDGRTVLGGRSLSRTEGGPGVRGSHPDCHHRRRRQCRRQAFQVAGRECHHPEHRSLFGQRGGRRHFHASCHLHSAGQVSRHVGLVHQHLHGLPAGRHPGHPVPHPLPQVFREGHARQIPVPRGHGHHTGADFGRKRRFAGQAIAHCGHRGRTLRLHRGHLRLVERELHHTRRGLGPAAGRQCQTGVQGEHRRRRAGLGLYRRTEICVHHLPRFAGRLVDYRTRTGPALPHRHP